MANPHCTIDEALEAFRNGECVVLEDDADRENEGDLIVAAQFATAEVINLMLREARGLVTVPMERSRLEELEIALIDLRNADALCPRFTVPVDALSLNSTGVSAADRAQTIRELLDPQSTVDSFLVPGHVFPLAAHPHGLEGRRGHTEGSVSLARLAGLYPAAVMCEVLREDGEMAKGQDLEAFALRLGVKVVSVEAIAQATAASVTP